MSLLVIDVDDTLTNSAPSFLASLDRRSRFNGDYERVFNFDLRHTYPDLTIEDMHQAWIEDKVLESVPWYGDKEAWIKLSQRLGSAGHDIVYCTSRGWHPDAHAITADSLKGAHGTVVVTPVFDTKAAVMSAMGLTPDLYIDDNFHNVMSMYKAFGCLSVLMYRPWNYLELWANRIDSPEGLHQVIEKRLPC